MKTIIAFSDTHGAPLPQKLISVAQETDFVFFLGDGAYSLGDITLHNGLKLVRGNCDAQGVLPDEQVVEIENMRMLLTHGHKYGVKRDLLALALRAKELDCSAVFYGHTHVACIETYGGITLICAGSACYPAGSAATYAFAAVYDGKITAKIVSL